MSFDVVSRIIKNIKKFFKQTKLGDMKEIPLDNIPNSCGIYILNYDRDKLSVGSAIKLNKRIKHHKKQSESKNSVFQNYFGCIWFWTINDILKDKLYNKFYCLRYLELITTLELMTIFNFMNVRGSIFTQMYFDDYKQKYKLKKFMLVEFRDGFKKHSQKLKNNDLLPQSKRQPNEIPSIYNNYEIDLLDDQDFKN